MGKASKWIRDFLLGKRVEKFRKNDTSLSAEYPSTKTGGQPATPKVKRRWSFGKAVGKRASHKFSKSLDTIDTLKLPVPASAEDEFQWNHAAALALLPGDVRSAAATRIQAAFRSYLARKALCALRALVKLQALVRGHLVRKQTTATLRRMHALISIQVRARVQRLQMADEAQPVFRREASSIHRNFTHDNGYRKIHREKMGSNVDENKGLFKTKSEYLNRSRIERIEQGLFYSGNLSISRREDQYEEYSFTAEKDPRHYLATSELNQAGPSSAFQQPDRTNYKSQPYPFVPNYMAKTQSSRAKVRSQSEPKHRPSSGTKQKSKQMESPDSSGPLDNQMRRTSSNSKHRSHENFDPWFVKLYRSTRPSDSRPDVNTPTSSHSNHYKSLDAYEPHLTLY